MADVFQIKVIKGRKWNIDAVRLEVLNALRAEGRDTEDMLKRFVKYWNNPPSFDSIIGFDRPPGYGAVLTGPTGDPDAVQHFQWTDEGTEPHIIRPRGPWRLRFPGTFESKTLPGVIDGRPGRSGPPTVYATEVHHPGTEPRNISQRVQQARKKRFTDRMIKAKQRGIRKAQQQGRRT